jgi:hypothetical protein
MFPSGIWDGEQITLVAINSEYVTFLSLVRVVLFYCQRRYVDILN